MHEGIADRFWLGDGEKKVEPVSMKLTEIAFFTDRVIQMTDFYRRFLGVDPVACSETMAIFLLMKRKSLFTIRMIRKTENYLRRTIMPLRWRMWIRPVTNWLSRA
jgi:hypothetical protein